MVQIHLDNLTQVGVHKFHDEINILELFQWPLRCKRVQKSDYLQKKERILSILRVQVKHFVNEFAN